VEHADFLWMTADRIRVEHQTQEAARTPGRPTANGRNPERLTGRHFVDYIPPTTKKVAPTRKCVVCCTVKKPDVKKVKKETRFYCPDCDVGSCVTPCFKDYHTKANYSAYIKLSARDYFIMSLFHICSHFE